MPWLLHFSILIEFLTLVPKLLDFFFIILSLLYALHLIYICNVNQEKNGANVIK